MKKRLFATLICLCMMMSMLPVSVFAAGEHSGHSDWQTLSGTITQDELYAGNYVLTGDVTLDTDVYLGELNKDSNIVICLNGYKIIGQGYGLVAGGRRSKNVTICDCTGNGQILNTTVNSVTNLNNITLNNCTIKAGASSSVNLNSGTKVGSGCTVEAFSAGTLNIYDGCQIESGAFVSIWKSVNADDGGNLRMYGGSVACGISIGSGCYAKISGDTVSGKITSSGTLDIVGGTISGSITVNTGTCNITGGTISVIDYTSTGETTGAVVVKGGSCNIEGTAQISGSRVDNGGAVSVIDGTCTISENNIRNNTTKYGGVYVVGGTCTIGENTVISGNTASSSGAGVHIDGGTCNIYGTVTDNTARYANGHGGGVYISAGECNIYGTVTKNTATANGGGVYAAGGTCTIYGSIEENTAVNGGGVYVAPGAQVYTRNTSSGLSSITNNTASGNGGGLYLGEGTQWDNICDISYNRAGYGGGIYGMDGCQLEVRVGSVNWNTADDFGGGLYLSDTPAKPCIVNLTGWNIRENTSDRLIPDNIFSWNSIITYKGISSTESSLPNDEPNSIILRDSASFTILKGKYTASEIDSCFTIESDSKIVIAGGYYDTDPAQQAALTISDAVKVMQIDESTGDFSYDANYPWAVYTFQNGLEGTANNPVYDGQPIEKGTDFTLNIYANQIKTFYYWYKNQGADDSTYLSGLPTVVGNYTIKVGGLYLFTVGSEWYAECTFDLTIAKADPSYTVPEGIVAQLGRPLSIVQLPEGWEWKDGSIIPQTEGVQNYTAIFTPDDTDNYNILEVEIPVSVEHAHEGVFVPEDPATCTTDGEKAYYECSICHKCFENEDCKTPISDFDSWKVIDALGHDFEDWTSNGDGTHTGTCQREGCDATDTQNCSGGTATYFRQAECAFCGAMYGSLIQDTTKPTGEIRVNEDSWSGFLNDITFGLFFKETQSVEIIASDDSYSVAGYTDDKAAVIEYYLYSGDSPLTEAELANTEFTVYNGPFNIDPDNKYVIYVRITDHAGNQTYISSDGIVLDGSAPTIDGIVDGGVYYVTQSVTVSDANFASVMVNNVEMGGKTFTLAGDTETTYTIVVKDLAGNVTEYTVTMKTIESLANQIDGLTTENVTSAEKPVIEAVKTAGTVDADDATADEQAKLDALVADCDELLGQIDTVQDAMNTESIRKVEDITSQTVETEDREDLVAARADIELVFTMYENNLTEEEKTALEKKVEQINSALDSIEKAEKAEEAINALPDTVKPDDTETEDLINETKNQYDALTDHEKTLVSKAAREKLERLLTELRAYEIIKGSGSKWEKGTETGLSFTANGAYSKFTGIEVDGEKVDEDYYTAVSGSTVITLKPEYLESLTAGKHILTVLYTDGEVSCEFEILSEDGAVSPETGENGNIMMWIALMFGSAGLLSAMVVSNKKRTAKNG